VFQFLKPLVQRGFECTLIEAPQRDWWKRTAYLPRLLHLARSQDVLYVQKRVFPETVLKLVRRINPHIIYDLDDAVYLRPALRARVDATLRAAMIVVAGNQYLAAYARKVNERVVVIPSVVDTDLYLPPSGDRHPGDDRVIIGWIGSDPNRGDLASMKPTFDWLGERYGEQAVLRIVSDRPLEMETRLRNEFVPWTLASSRAELQQFDIGIMPLEDNEWNGVNQEIVINEKTGYLAATVSEWQQRLANLIECVQIRMQMGHTARQRVEQQYSVMSVLPLMVDTLRRGALSQ
jgi:glycosyltransferase involved in cell wall biosynthesis